ncbi:hypothetical protein ACQZ3V_01950 [Ralstonia pseudosolanacearum]|uniref:hypothetical protein n=1 Tax=Ralstonia pseudosolanacearum TaxID=1310165 RepID=UPI001FFB3AA1
MTVTTKCIALWLAIGGLVFGLIAAWYWFRSTRVPIDPLNGNPNAIMPVEPAVERLAWLAAQFRANQEVGRLNTIAASLTAVAVVLSTASSVVGML